MSLNHFELQEEVYNKMLLYLDELLQEKHPELWSKKSSIANETRQIDNNDIMVDAIIGNNDVLQYTRL